MATHFLKRSLLACKHVTLSSHHLYKIFSTSCLLNNGTYTDGTKFDSVVVGFENLTNKIKNHVESSNEGEDYIPVQTQDELVSRSASDSVQELIIPLGHELRVREKYLNIYGFVRFGKLLESMDALAAWIGFKYYKGPTQRPPFNLVTAYVDSIDFSACQILPNQDLKLQGFVSWAGRTSLEVTMYIEQQGITGEWKKLSKAVFKMAARSVHDGSGAIINKINPQTAEEIMYFKKGEENKINQQNRCDDSLLNTAPTEIEREIIHHMFLKTIDTEKAKFHVQNKPVNTVWMENTILKNLIICHPQSRNVYNKIFGGFLMRVALELSFANASVFMKSRPIITGMDDIVFRRPVEIGTLLYLSSIIVYTNDQYLQTSIVAESVDPKTGKRETTNTFHFHFACEKNIPQIMPKTYGEYILYLNGRRHCPLHLRKD